MAYSYTVSYGTSATGPWTGAGTVSATTDTISGLNPGVNYYFQVVTTDSVTGFQSAPVVSGPFQTASGITGVTLSSQAFSASPGNVGTIAVQTSGQPFTGTLSLTGTNAANFTISGTTLTVKTGIGSGTYAVNVVATQAGYVGSPFTQAFTITGTVAGAESPAGTLITTQVTPTINASPTPGTETSSTVITAGTAGSGNIIAITSGAQISVNGVVLTGTASVTQLYYINHNCFQFGGGFWWGPVSTPGAGATALAGTPIPSIQSITLSASTIAPSAATGTTVGKIVVNTTAAPAAFTYAGTYSLTPGNVTGESAAGTSVTTTTASITGSATPGTPGAQNVFTITSGGQVSVAASGAASQVITATNGVVQLYYINHGCYQLNNAGNWYGPMTATDGGNPLTATPVVAANAVNLFAISSNSVVTLAPLLAGSYSFRISTAAASVTTVSGGTPVTIPAFNQLITVTVGNVSTGLVQVPFGVFLGTSLGGGGGTEGSIKNHIADVIKDITTPVIYGAQLNFPGGSIPWSTDAGSWTAANGLPMDGSAVPFLHATFSDGTSENGWTCQEFVKAANGTFDTALQNVLNQWKAVAPFKKMYLRINWEFNSGNYQFYDSNGNPTPGYGVPPGSVMVPAVTNAQNVANFVSAYKHWCNVCHTWGNNNNVDMRMVWSPDAAYTNANSLTFNLPVVDYFPVPDSSAVNGAYIDVVGIDAYINGYSVDGAVGFPPIANGGIDQAYTTNLATLQASTNWSVGTYVAMAQQYNANFAISETGTYSDTDLSYSSGNLLSWTNYLNTLATLTPPVIIEYVCLFDVTFGSGLGQVTGSTGTNEVKCCQAWNCLFGNGAVQPQAGVTFPPLKSIGQVSTPTSTLQVPPALAANGLSSWQVVFFDDFTSASTVTTSTTATSGFNWYGNASSTLSVLTTTTAAQISNGNTSGGSNASPAGGIFEVTGNTGGAYNSNWVGCVNQGNGGALATNASGKPNYWKHAYFEAYVQWNANGGSGLTTVTQNPTFPAFWSWSVYTSPTMVEIDFVEQYYSTEPPKTTTTTTDWQVFDPGGGGGTGGGKVGPNWDSQWHTIGCLWRSTSATAGAISVYIDGVQTGSTIPTGPGTTVPDMELVVGQYMVLGTGYNWPMYVDWVRVWQAPS